MNKPDHHTMCRWPEFTKSMSDLGVVIVGYLLQILVGFAGKCLMNIKSK